MAETLGTPKEKRVAADNANAAEKWRSWIEGRIRDDVLWLNLQRTVWDGMQTVITGNRELPRRSTLWEYQFGTYTTSQGAAVRRLTETGKRNPVASLGNCCTRSVRATKARSRASGS